MQFINFKEVSVIQIRVDYSELVEAIQNDDDAKASQLLAEITPRLQDYLRVVMRASPDVAEECVQQAFLSVYEQIKSDNIKKNHYIFRYLIKATRHEYYRYMKQQHKFEFHSSMGHICDAEEQLENLYETDRQKILEECLEELSEDNREFISYFINKPNASTEEIMREFNLTNANARTKKSRLLSRLHHCYKRKSSY